MSQVRSIKIFLASPNDVNRERKYVSEVIDEINDTVAIDKSITLRMVSSANTFPGYGKDGQAVLNEQIGIMKEYDLFLGIMWSRIGTKTPRATSGTVEEFNRAVRSLKSNSKPEIWFYFRELKANVDSEEKIKQAQGVVRFKKKIQPKVFVHDYKTPSDFKKRFRKAMLLWLDKHWGTASKPVPSITDKKSATASSRRQATTKKASTSRTNTVNKKVVRQSSRTKSVSSVTSSLSWIMLSDNFFLTQSVIFKSDGSIIVRIVPKNATEETALLSLNSRNQYWGSEIAYAYQNDAGNTTIQDILPESIKGKTTYVLTLFRDQRSQGYGMEASVNGYSPNEMAELRARLILLNETPVNQKEGCILRHVSGLNSQITIEESIFPNLWEMMKRSPDLFLRKARLAAVYQLKMSNTVEHILDFRLGSIKNRELSVSFRGQRKDNVYSGNPHVIEVKGKCKL